MRRLDRSLDEIMDRIGLRIIVPSVEECYAVLGLLHTRFRPIPGTFDDYIGLPKENGCQSLHTCVYPVPEVSVKPVEFQIRTEKMHREAGFGVAAHWLYKNQAKAEAEDRRQLERLRDLLPQGENGLSHATFVDRLHRQVYDNRLVVFQRTGQPMRLPANTTVRDLIGRLARPGESKVIVRVNGVVHPHDYPLRDGDTLELTAPLPPDERVQFHVPGGA